MEESRIFDTSRPAEVSVASFHDFTLLSSTGTSTLYRASKAGKYFFVKTAKEHTERQCAMLRREYELCMACDHPHIVHVFTIEENLPVGLSLIMEYIEGRTLKEFLAEKPSRSERNRVFEELLTAVDYLHKRGIIHNDLKPENILITRANNSVKLIDFGLADSYPEFARKQLGCTPRYAAPELSAQLSPSDARSDIYSIGVIMQEIFPYSHKLIAWRCTRNRPALRYPHCGALLQAWRRRNMPFKLLGALLILIAIALPISHIIIKEQEHRKFKDYSTQQIHSMEHTIDSIKQERSESEKSYTQQIHNMEQTIDSFKQERSNYEEFCTQQLTLLEHTVDSICLATIDSVRNSHYADFANIYMVRMSEQCYAFGNKLMAATTDPNLQAILSTRLGNTMQKHWPELIKLCDKLPLITATDLSPEEKAFYKSLVDKKQGWREYKSAE
jgi:serine/threonine protein kinase